MNIIAYMALRHYLFSQMIPAMDAEDFKILPVNIQKILIKMGKNHREDFSLFWDYIFTNDKYDFLWSYHKPDEITLEKCKQHKVPVLVQEFFGRHPSWLPSVFPFDCDYMAAYAKNKSSLPALKKGKRPVIIIPIEDMMTYERSLESMFGNYIKGHTVNNYDMSYWDTDEIISSSMTFVQKVVEIILGHAELRDCKVLFRPYINRMNEFAAELDFIKGLNIPNIGIDTSNIAASLNAADIIVCTNSNYGVDGLRNGSELIAYGGKAYYLNPQLAEVSMNLSELEQSLIKCVKKIKTQGKQIKPFMPSLLKDLAKPLACDCEAPYDPDKMKNALKYAFSLPRISL